jgi:hypothetical protein
MARWPKLASEYTDEANCAKHSKLLISGANTKVFNFNNNF